MTAAIAALQAACDAQPHETEEPTISIAHETEESTPAVPAPDEVHVEVRSLDSRPPLDDGYGSSHADGSPDADESAPPAAQAHGERGGRNRPSRAAVRPAS